MSETGVVYAKPVDLIPHDTVSGRALTAVIAILTFLACLCAGGAVMMAVSSAAWREEVSREITIQIPPHPGVDAEAEVARVMSAVVASPVVASARAPAAEETHAALAPWLGSGLDLTQLPIPRLIVATLSSRDGGALETLRAEVAKAAPGAMLDDHAVWLSHLSSVGRSLTLFAFGLLALVVAAIAIAVGFATRGAMAGAREIVDVLHFVGASDAFITRHFQLYFTRVSAEGTSVGGGAAMGLFFIGGLVAARNSATADGAAWTVLVGSFHLPLSGYAAILGVCAALVAMAGLFSRVVAAAHLRGLG